MELRAKKLDPVFITMILLFFLLPYIYHNFGVKVDRGSCMDLIAPKSETSLRRRNSFNTSDASSSTVKRRRRCPSMLSLNDPKTIGDENQLLQTSTTPIMDQSSSVVTPSTPTTPTTPTTVKRSSKFRGVSRHRWTGRYEAHLWDKGSWNATQKKKGKQGKKDGHFINQRT